MIHLGQRRGENAIVQIVNGRQWMIAATLFASVLISACGAGGPAPGNSNETAATVNGKVIKMEEVDRGIKQQAQGKEAQMSPLELAGARLQVLQSLIEQEVMVQKAQKENLMPTDEEVNAEVNKQKQESRLSAEEFDKQMTAAGYNEAALKENTKRSLAIKKLVDKITSRIEPAKDKEITDLYAGNPEMFVKKRGVKLAAIVVDPANSGQGDVTTNEGEASVKLKEILGKLVQPGSDFAALAREYSEDSSSLQGGDLGYINEEQLKQEFGAQNAAGFMNPSFAVGAITNVIPLNGKGYIFKLQERVEKEENLTLDSPGVRQQITDLLVNNRKQLLAASYQAVAMNEAKIENYLAKKVVDNPNELSGARPAGAATPAANTNANTAAANTNTAANTANANANAKPAANTTAKPEAKPATPAKK